MSCVCSLLRQPRESPGRNKWPNQLPMTGSPSTTACSKSRRSDPHLPDHAHDVKASAGYQDTVPVGMPLRRSSFATSAEIPGIARSRAFVTYRPIDRNQHRVIDKSPAVVSPTGALRVTTTQTGASLLPGGAPVGRSGFGSAVAIVRHIFLHVT
jgi:hypothetical protein